MVISLGLGGWLALAVVVALIIAFCVLLFVGGINLMNEITDLVEDQELD